MRSKTRGMISAGHPQTAEAAARILEEGGNAFDAATAALLTSFSTESCMSSPGGGGFANIRTGTGQSMIIDFFCQTPFQKHRPEDLEFYPVLVDFGEKQEEFHIGLGSAAAPGSIAGLFEIHRRFGSLPFSIIGEFAIETAKNGALVDDFQHFDFKLLKNILLESPDAIEIFFRDGKVIPSGEYIKMPNLADFLDALLREGESLFYKGEICRTIVENSKSRGGSLSRKDLESYSCNILDPLELEFKGHRVYTNPLPSIGGSMMALCLDHLRNNISNERSGKIDVHSLSKSLIYMSRLRKEPALLHEKLLAAGINSNYSDDSNPVIKRGTTHFNILDEHQNAISISTSNGEGSGYMIPGTQIMLNNMLGEIALLPGGFHTWKKNVRLSSMMTPTIVLNGDKQVSTVMGSGGASRIPGAITQVLLQMMESGLNADDAVHSPRMHVAGNHFHTEPGLDLSANQIPPEMELHPWQNTNMFFGGVHVISQKNGHMEGTGDRRRCGVFREVL